MRTAKELLYNWMGGNEVIFHGINNIRGPYYDQAMKIISWLGNHELFPVYVALLLGWVFLSTFMRLVMGKKGIGYFLSVWVGIFIVLVTGYAANGLVIKGVKEAFSYERPYVVFQNTGTIYVLEDAESDDANHSFPSGHVAFTIFMVVALWPVLNSAGMWLGVISIILMCWSRISVGMHFPADVVGAVLISLPFMLLFQGMVYYLLFKIFRLKC